MAVAMPAAWIAALDGTGWCEGHKRCDFSAISQQFFLLFAHCSAVRDLHSSGPEPTRAARAIMSEETKGEERRHAREKEEEEEEKEFKALDERDIKLLKTYVRAHAKRRFPVPAAHSATRCVQGQGPYTRVIKATETDIEAIQKRVHELVGATSVLLRLRRSS